MTEKVIEKRRLASPATTPQALAWDRRNNRLWMGSRDLRRIYAIDPEKGTVLKQQEAPGIPWAAVAVNGELRFTIGEEICGHTFANGAFYVLRGQEQPHEDWRIARLNPQEETPAAEDIAVVPFACRSLTFDGERFWSNHRAKDTIIS